MAASTKRFTLTTAAYQDISEGLESCSLRLPYISQRSNAIRVALSTSLPSASTTNYDQFASPDNKAEEFQIHFLELASTDRVYARAESGTVVITAYRK